MQRLFYAVVLFIALACPSMVWAEGTQFNGNCSRFTWFQNIETDLAGYKIYDRSSQSVSHTLKATLGQSIGSATCLSLQFNAGQHYTAISAFDTSGNESPLTPDIPFVIVYSNIVQDLTVTAVTTTTLTLQFTEVDGGLGAPASYDVRFAVGALAWGTAASVSAGTCSTPVAGTAIGALKSCTITGLTDATNYQVQLVPFRGTLLVDAVFSPLSNVASATTGGSVPGATNRLELVLDNFDVPPSTDHVLYDPPWMSNYTGSNNLSSLSGNVSQAAVNQAAVAVYRSSSIAFPPDQWAEMRIDVWPASLQTLQVGLRWATTPATSGYTCLARENGTYTSAIRIYTSLGNSNTMVSENATTWATTDTFRCEVHTQADGELIEMYRNADVSPLLSYLDTAHTYTSGQPGIIVNSATAAGDNWRAGYFAPVASTDACGCDQH